MGIGQRETHRTLGDGLAVNAGPIILKVVSIIQNGRKNEYSY